MLNIIRTLPTGGSSMAYMDASIRYRHNRTGVEELPDVTFNIRTYHKISEEKPNKVGFFINGKAAGELILLPINLFFDSMPIDEQKVFYDLYAEARVLTDAMQPDTIRDTQLRIRTMVTDLIQKHHIPERLIDFCSKPPFMYPDLSDVGNKPHHTPEKTFLVQDYIEITAISLLCKIMAPIWGQFVKRLEEVSVEPNQRVKIAFDIIEPSLTDGAFRQVYRKLHYLLASITELIRKSTDKKTIGGTNTSYILTLNGVDINVFNELIMSTIIVKRMATYDCFTMLNDNPPNAMVYIDNGIKKTTESAIQQMRKDMTMMPHRQLNNNETDDNNSILDHISKTSRKPIDTPILVSTFARLYGIPNLLVESKTPMDVFNSAMAYYESNPFDISPLVESMVASFAGTRFGGSRCLGWLEPDLYRQLVVMLQIYLIRRGMMDLATLVSSVSSASPVEGVESPLAGRILNTADTSREYNRMLELIKGFVEKPNSLVKRKTQRKQEDGMKIDFISLIKRLIEWLTRYEHSENMAPVLWDYAKVDVGSRPIVGSECKFDQYIIRDLCKFFLIFHDERKPFEDFENEGALVPAS